MRELETRLQAFEERSQSAPEAPPGQAVGGRHVGTTQRRDGDLDLDHDWQGNTESQAAPDCPPRLTGAVHLGQSSTGVFIRELQDSITLSAPRPTTRVVTLDDLAAQTPVGTRVSSDYVLPPRHDAEVLLAIYRGVHYPVYPAVIWDDFSADLDALYSGSARPGRCRMTHCLANLFFALAERSKLREAQGSAGADYFERAKRLLHLDVFGDVSFRAIQALVLCAQYLQSTEKPRQCWVIVGVAIRAAQSVGLHMAEAVENIQPARDRCLASVVWSCLATLDRTLSMTLGRPPTLSLSAAKATGILNRALVAEPSLQIPGLFVHSYRLFDILHEILASHYSEGTKAALGLEVLGHTSRLERELDRWTRELPSELRLREDSAALGQAHFLRQRCLQVLMILFRPGLSAVIKSSSSTAERDLEEATAWYCTTRCIEAAREMVDIAALQSEADARGAPVAPWWYNVQFCYNAGASLLAARLSRGTAERLGVPGLDESLGKCIRTLESYGSLCPTNSRCLSAFASVAEKAGYVLPGMATGVPESQSGVDPINIDALLAEDYWGLEWTGTSSTIFDQLGLLDCVLELNTS